MKYKSAEKYVLGLLGREIPKGIFYHNLTHTQEVIAASERIGRAERVTGEDLSLLKTAALLHDSGFLKDYEDHEANGCVFAQLILPEFEYKPGQIDTVCNLIMATKQNGNPETLLEKIINDADLDYLGSLRYEEISSKLYREFLQKGKIQNADQWLEKQIDFLENHRYHTATAIATREQLKLQNLNALRLQRIKREQKKTSAGSKAHLLVN